MLAALIPVSDSLRVTGATDVFAGLLAQRWRRPAGLGRGRADAGRGDGGDALPQQCRDRAGDGADRRGLRQDARLHRPTPS
jgi:hypothetical protein